MNQKPTTTMIQYGKQTIEPCDIQAVVEVLQTNTFLTTGPWVTKFEQAISELIGVKHAVAVSNGTAALHCAMYAIDLKPSEEVIVAAISFAASANCVIYCGGVPVFCDVQEDTLNIDPSKIEKLITNKTRAVIMVDFAGQPPDYHPIREICQRRNLILIEDAAHTIGLQVNRCPTHPYVGNIADLTTFSFHPVKNMTTAEGGMITTNNDLYAKRLRTFRNHGIDVEYNNRNGYEYDIKDVGYNYRLTDMQCALGLSQLKRLSSWIDKRNQIAEKYHNGFREIEKYLKPLKNNNGSAYHIYVIKLILENLDCNRDVIFAELKEKGIGVNVHYKPIYQHTYYQKNPKIRSDPKLFPVSEKIYKQIITIPMFPTLTDDQTDTVIRVVKETILQHAITVK